MSIYGSTIMFWDEHTEDCGKWVEDPEIERCFDLDDSRPCTCHFRDAPIRYQGSHVLPDTKDEREGKFDLGEIAGHITRDGRDDRDDDSPWPFLRVSLNGETVVLDDGQIRDLVRYLDDWIDRVDEAFDPAPSLPTEEEGTD